VRYHGPICALLAECSTIVPGVRMVSPR
jgi:hypothetical protein